MKAKKKLGIPPVDREKLNVALGVKRLSKEAEEAYITARTMYHEICGVNSFKFESLAIIALVIKQTCKELEYQPEKAKPKTGAK